MPYELEFVPDSFWIVDQLNTIITALGDFQGKTRNDIESLNRLIIRLSECALQAQNLIENEALLKKSA